MSDDTTTGTDVTAAAADTTDTTDTTSQDRTVPYDRFQQVNQKARDAEAQVKEMETRLQELEDRDKSEVERERTKREQFERQAGELSQRLERVERSGWIRAAAAEAGFDDPDDATHFIDPSGIESAEQAEKEVKRLAKRKPKLLRDAAPGPQIGQVLANGQRVDPNAVAAQQRDEAAEAFQAQIKAAQDEAGWQSLPLQ